MADSSIEFSGPIIGISGAKSDTESVAAAMATVRAHGGIPMLLADHAGRNADQDIAVIDALIVLGNNQDIDPARYGQAAHPVTQVETDLARAAYEERIIQLALDHNVPLLTVCGGMQRMNVMGGGTLIQDLLEKLGTTLHTQKNASGGVPMYMPAHGIQPMAGTRAEALSGGVEFLDNSAHHQAVDRVRSDFIISARAPDGTAEAIEPAPGSRYANNDFVLGVQWHPEFGASHVSANITGQLVETARAHAQHKSAARAAAAEASGLSMELRAAGETAISAAPAIAKAADQGSPAATTWVQYVVNQRQERQAGEPQLGMGA